MEGEQMEKGGIEEPSIPSAYNSPDGSSSRLSSFPWLQRGMEHDPGSWFQYEMFTVEDLVASWWCYFGRF